MKEKENLTIPSYNSLHHRNPPNYYKLHLLMITKKEMKVMILKSVSKETSFFPAHGTIACLYCGDCLAHWAFATYDGNCKLFNT